MDSYSDNGALIGLLVVFGLVFFVIGIGVYVVSSYFYMRLFDKAGVQGRWRGWVPVYREMLFAKLGDLSPWWLLVLFIATAVLTPTGIGSIIGIAITVYLALAGIGSIIGIAITVYLALAAYRIGQKLQKDGVWVVLYVLLSIVWLGIVALDRSRWNTAIAPAAWAGNFLADKTVWQGVPAQPAAPQGPGAYPPPAYGAPPPGAYPPPPGSYPPPAPPGPPSATPPPAPEGPEDPNAPRP